MFRFQIVFHASTLPPREKKDFFKKFGFEAEAVQGLGRRGGLEACSPNTNIRKTSAKPPAIAQASFPSATSQPQSHWFHERKTRKCFQDIDIKLWSSKNTCDVVL